MLWTAGEIVAHAGDNAAATVTSVSDACGQLVDNAVQAASPVPPAPTRALSTIHRPYYYDNQEFQILTVSRRTR